jgi:hypothetical protein
MYIDESKAYIPNVTETKCDCCGIGLYIDLTLCPPEYGPTLCRNCRKMWRRWNNKEVTCANKN